MNTAAILPVNLGDKRLDSRCNKLIEQLMAKPSSSIPQACVSWKDTKAAYRFFANDEINPEDIFKAHYGETVRRIQKTDGIILVPQDTTELSYTTHRKTTGLGSMGSFKNLYGMHVHSALAATEAGVPLGLLHQYRWVRDPKVFGQRTKNRYKSYFLPMEQKESIRWIKTLEAVEEAIPNNKTVVVIGDRESDIYPLFAHKRKPNVHLLVRASINRGVVSEEQKLFSTMEAVPKAGTITIQLNKTPVRKPRQAILTIKYTEVTLKSPNVGKGRAKGRAKLFCVQAKEEHPPKGEQAVSWTLLTTIPVDTFEDAVKIINWYTRRWLIERFHFALKSGCKIEELQLHERTRLERALALYTIVAWQLLYITYETRENPNTPCTKILSTHEWQALVSMSEGRKTRRTKPPTMQEAVHMIARLGGFLGRKGDREPGVKTLWIGLRRLSDIAATWHLLLRVDEDVGKG